MKKPQVLICMASTIPDNGLAPVIDGLRARGARPVVFDTVQFPRDIGLAVKPGGSGVLLLPDEQVALEDLSAVWLRHTDPGAALSVGEDWADAVRGQATTALWGTLRSLQVRWLDDPAKLAAVPEHVGQLSIAQRLGLTIPRTVLTNDPAAVAQLWDACKGEVIFKLPHSSSFQVEEEDGRTHFVPTQALTAELLADHERIRVCPLTYQERIPKSLELRVTIVGERLFVAAVNMQDRAEVDWRQHRELVGSFRAYDGLDPVVSARLLELMKHLGLRFGTVDLIVRPDGQTVFLELNTVSFFDFVEAATGLPIAAAIVEELLGS